MSSATFTGEVHGGQLLIGQPLTEFEGKKVVVTLSVEDTQTPPAEPVRDTSHIVAAEEAEILEDCGRIDIPPRDVVTVKFRFVDIGRIPMGVYADDDCEVWDD